MLIWLRTHTGSCVRRHEKSDGELDLRIGSLVFVIIRPAQWCAVRQSLRGVHRGYVPFGSLADINERANVRFPPEPAVTG